ncbi:hypothetical protein LTR37_005046 [Vermiconidia calcicola]|uniref:Uncharacterized protein n=1 Tax=Vermiconidia calcicola TaxID=1690605 RepID=A0ACC3NM12_9PEZI|nr:hypothetical protein LTR37_005046 [Vermiconidia calcicola]
MIASIQWLSRLERETQPDFRIAAIDIRSTSYLNTWMDNFGYPELASIVPGSTSGQHEQLRAAARKCPRFLFRVWSSASGGNKRLNTVDAIIPRAFLNGKGPTDISELFPGKLANLVSAHWSGEHVATVFSSWSQSLHYVLIWANSIASGSGRYSNVHISIIDTKRLPDSNPVFWTPALARISPGLPYCPWEFLAFGTISGPAHKAVKYDELMELGISKLIDLTPLHLREPGLATSETVSIQEAITLVKRISEQFGQDFAVPAAVYLLSCHDCHDTVDEQTAVNLFAEADIPQAWHDDPTIMIDDVFIGGFEDVQTAIALLRKLVENARGDGESVGMKRESDTPPTADLELVEGQNAARKPRRMLKVMKDLDIDMVGW